MVPKWPTIRPKLCDYRGDCSMKRVPLAERVRGRLNELIAQRGMSHEAIAPHLEISASAVSKLLSGKNQIGLDHIDGFCVALQISVGEIMAEPFAAIQAISPLEASILDIVRKMNELTRHSLVTVLEWPARSSVHVKRTGRTPDHLSPEDAMVLSLYRGLEDADAQAGIVMQMRGYVQAKQDARTGKARGGK
jgi:DNA-binding Xre family transcriptional regulator